MVDNKSDVDSPTPFATGSTGRAEVSSAAGGSVGHSTSSHHHGHHHDPAASQEHVQSEVPVDHQAGVSEDERITGGWGRQAPSATQQASDREPAEGGEPGDEIAGMDEATQEATGASAGGDLVDETGSAGFSPGTEGGLGDGAAAYDTAAASIRIGETSPAPEESRPPENL